MVPPAANACRNEIDLQMRMNIIERRHDAQIRSPEMLEVRDSAHLDHDPRPLPRASVADPCVPEHDSRRLLQGQREVVIRHGGECYRLRHTRNDKLILTK